MRRFTVEIEPDGTVHRIGIQTGKVTLMAINEEHGLVAFKVAGHTAWVSGFNPRQYVPARYVVFRYELIEERHDGTKVIEMDELFGDLEWDARKKK